MFAVSSECRVELVWCSSSSGLSVDSLSNVVPDARGGPSILSQSIQDSPLVVLPQSGPRVQG